MSQMCNHLLNPRKYWVLERDRRPQLTQDVTLVDDVGDSRICKSLKRWRPRRDLNPRLRRERAMTSWITLYLQGSGRSAMPCKEQLGTLRRIFWLYRSCTASFVGVSPESEVCRSVALENEPQGSFLPKFPQICAAASPTEANGIVAIRLKSLPVPCNSKSVTGCEDPDWAGTNL